MKHELEMLQQKISNLNVAQQQHYQLMHHNQMLQQQQHQGQQLLQQTTPGQNGMPMGQPGGGVPTSFNSLTSELQLIEKTIRDREMELQINTCMQKESPQGLDYGSYIAHGKMKKHQELFKDFKKDFTKFFKTRVFGKWAFQPASIL